MINGHKDMQKNPICQIAGSKSAAPETADLQHPKVFPIFVFGKAPADGANRC